MIEKLANAMAVIPSGKKGRILFQCVPDFFTGYAYLFSKQTPGLRQTFGCQLEREVCAEYQKQIGRAHV